MSKLEENLLPLFQTMASLILSYDQHVVNLLFQSRVVDHQPVSTSFFGTSNLRVAQCERVGVMRSASGRPFTVFLIGFL